MSIICKITGMVFNTNFSRLYAGLGLCVYQGKRNKPLKEKSCKISFRLCGELVLLELKACK